MRFQQTTPPQSIRERQLIRVECDNNMLFQMIEAITIQIRSLQSSQWSNKWILPLPFLPKNRQED